MRNSFQQRCKLEFERYAENICNTSPDQFGIVGAEVPWASGGWCFTQAMIPHLLCRVRAALKAKAWFAEHGPDWAKPLPIDGRDYSAMIRGGGPLHLLGMYALSLEMLAYDYAA